MANGFGTVNPGTAAAGCGVPPAPMPFGGLFGGNMWWIWIVLLLIFVLPGCGLGGLGGFFGGFSWIWIVILLIFLFPRILPGFGLGAPGGFAV